MQMTATVNEDATNKAVSWSVEPSGYASINDDGLLTGLKAGEVTVTATAKDGSGVTGEKTITILPDAIESFELVDGTPAVQHAGTPFNSDGLVFNATYPGKGVIEVDNSSIVFSPETLQKDTTEVIATFDGKSISIPVEISNSAKYYFGEHDSFTNGDFPTSYSGADITLPYDNFSVRFIGAIKNSSTISDKPVSKKGTVTVTAIDGYLIKNVEIGFEKWPKKTQNIDLYISNDGNSYGEKVKSLTISSDTESLQYSDNAGFKAAKFEATSDNQVGWDYISIELAEETTDNSEAVAFAEMFLEEITCDDGVTAPNASNWDDIALLYDDLTSADKEVLKTASANAEGTEIEQCVARYDYIVGKYGPETYNDFMGRKPAPIASALSIHNSDDVMDIAVISALAVAGIAAAGAFVFLRRKKEA